MYGRRALSERNAWQEACQAVLDCDAKAALRAVLSYSGVERSRRC